MAAMSADVAAEGGQHPRSRPSAIFIRFLIGWRRPIAVTRA